MDRFECAAHRAGGVCQGGCHCGYCRRRPTSSAGARRLARDRARSRRVARARILRETIRLINDR
jgi:hypothetical protein